MIFQKIYNLQNQNIQNQKVEKKLNGSSLNQFTQEEVDKLIEMMTKAKKPIIYSGGGVINSGPKASDALRELVDLTGFPITSTLQGLGAYPGDDINS